MAFAESPRVMIIPGAAESDEEDLGRFILS